MVEPYMMRKFSCVTAIARLLRRHCMFCSDISVFCNLDVNFSLYRLPIVPVVLFYPDLS